MADARRTERANGFSLVEMLVALVFTLVLMAGMATVFKASLSSFYTAGETVSSARRNRMSIDLLSDDLDTACMFLMNLSTGPTDISTGNPTFYVLPNCSITGAPGTLGPNDPVTGDELYFYVDQPLPFEGTLGAVAPQRTASELVMQDAAATVADNTYTIDCSSNPAYASMVKQGQQFIFTDSWETAYVSAAPAITGANNDQVTVIAGPDPNAMITGSGSSGLPIKAKHFANSKILFVQAGEMVRYRLQWLQLDPANPNGVPCLVRDQGAYSTTGFTLDLPPQQQQIIAENVQGFKVYLSVNSGQTWAGLGMAPGDPIPAPGTGFSANWDGAGGIRTMLDTQLSTGVGSVPASGRPGFTSTRVSEQWFRLIPTLVRVDITTRSATQRTEYSTTADTAAYKQLTQSLIFVPRHSGLPIGW